MTSRLEEEEIRSKAMYAVNKFVESLNGSDQDALDPHIQKELYGKAVDSDKDVPTISWLKERINAPHEVVLKLIRDNKIPTELHQYPDLQAKLCDIVKEKLLAVQKRREDEIQRQAETVEPLTAEPEREPAEEDKRLLQLDKVVGDDCMRWFEAFTRGELDKTNGLTKPNVVYEKAIEQAKSVMPSYSNFTEGKLHAELMLAIHDLCKTYSPRTLQAAGGVEKFNMYDAAGQMMRECRMITTSVNKTLYGFNEDIGIYIPHETNLEQDLNDKYTPQEITPSEIANTVEIIKNRTHVRQTESMRELDMFNQNKEVIVVENGILNLKTWEYSAEFDPDLKATRRYPVVYDEKAECPKIMKALEAWTDGDKNKIQALREVIAVTIIPQRIVQKAFVLWGEGGNGKSTFLRLLVKIVGKNNISTQSLKTMSENEWAGWESFDKVAIISSDGDTSRIKSTEFFKKLAGGDTIRVHGKYTKAYEFDPDCNVIQTYNEAPQMPKEKGIGYVRKVYPIHFDQSFEEDSRFEHDLLNDQEELSGLLNWVKPTIQNIMNGKGLENPPSPAEVMFMLKIDSEPVYQFAQEHLEFCQGVNTDTDEIFGAYMSLYEQDITSDKEKARRKNSFTREIKRAFDGKVSSKVVKRDGKHARAYTNLRFKQTADSGLDPYSTA